MTGSGQFETTTPIAKDRYYGLQHARVEQRIDPMRLGRVRVRVFGLHDPSIQVEELPWAWPSARAWRKGGDMNIPPLGEVVGILFRDGDPEYPFWFGGHWGVIQDGELEGTTETPDGQDLSEHLNHPTSHFGGDPWEEGLLAIEQIKDVRPEDAPNNYGFISPLNKHYELDDRRNREKVKLSDQHDNMLWINSQRPAATLEVAQAADQIPKEDEPPALPMGVTFNADEEVLSWEIYGEGGFVDGRWNVTSDLKHGFIELAAPGNFKVHIDRRRKRVEVWTGQGHHLIMCDGMTTNDIAELTTEQGDFEQSVARRVAGGTLVEGTRATDLKTRSKREDWVRSSFVSLTTAGGQQLVMADSLLPDNLKTMWLASPNGSYVTLHQEGGGVDPQVEIYSATKLTLLAEEDIGIRSIAGNVSLNGIQVHSNSVVSGAPTVPAMKQTMAPHANQPWFITPAETRPIIKAQDYPFYGKEDAAETDAEAAFGDVLDEINERFDQWAANEKRSPS